MHVLKLFVLKTETDTKKSKANFIPYKLYYFYYYESNNLKLEYILDIPKCLVKKVLFLNSTSYVMLEK